jgi:hypothetical protein
VIFREEVDEFYQALGFDAPRIEAVQQQKLENKKPPLALIHRG